MVKTLQFHDEAALLDRLSTGLSRRPQEVIFLVGAPLSSPMLSGLPGVPDVGGMIDLIRSEFDSDPAERLALEQELSRSGPENLPRCVLFSARKARTANCERNCLPSGPRSSRGWREAALHRFQGSGRSRERLSHIGGGSFWVASESRHRSLR